MMRGRKYSVGERYAELKDSRFHNNYACVQAADDDYIQFFFFIHKEKEKIVKKFTDARSVQVRLNFLGSGSGGRNRILLSVKAGEMEWATARFYGKDNRIFFSDIMEGDMESGLRIDLVLVDAPTGTVKGMQILTPSHEFCTRWNQAIYLELTRGEASPFEAEFNA